MIRIIECCMCNKMAKANLILTNTNICTRCEKKIMATKIEDKDYLRYKEGIKQVWRVFLDKATDAIGRGTF